MGLYDVPLQANLTALRPEHGIVASLASVDYTNADAKYGFAIFVPDDVSGTIKVTTQGGETLTIADGNYTCGDFLRGGARFSKIFKTGTTVIGLEIWY
jgi:hypothetical protein